MVEQNPVGTSLLRIGGAFTAGFSLIMGLLVLFNVIPNPCSFLSSLELLILGFLFIIGVIAFSLGNTLVRKRMVETNPKGGPKCKSSA